MAVKERIVCTQCGQSRPSTNYFMMKNHEQYPVCKPCLTMYIDNTDPETFKWILEKFDVPYIEKVWKDEAQKAYEKNPATFSSSSVLGRYLRVMNMQQYRNYTYADTMRLQVKMEKEQEEIAARTNPLTQQAQEEFAALQARLDAGEISQAEFDTLNPLTRGMDRISKPVYTFAKDERITEEEILEQLSADEKKMLSQKWGNTYSPSQWLAMEEMYQGYSSEYELNVDSKAVVKQICQVYLKMNEALTLGDMNAHKALAATYDSLRKSASLTKAQNKEDKQGYLDSIGELVKFCEQRGGIIEQIPYPDEYPQDDVDYAIKNLKAYYYDLVTNELSLGNLIEAYIKRLEESEKNEEIDYEAGLVTSEEEAAKVAEDLEAEEMSQTFEDIENEIEQILQDKSGDI